VRVWGALALAGLLLGAAFTLASPSLSQAETTLLLTVGPEPAPGTAIQNEQVVAQSRPVAALALKKLRLPEDPGSFQQSYTVAVLTDQALLVTVSAPSNSEAVTRAKALAAAFLQFRTGVLEAQQRGYFLALDQNVSQQRQLVDTLTRQIRQVSAQPASTSQRARIGALQSDRRDANNTLQTIVQNVATEKAAAENVTNLQVSQSKVVNPAAPILQSRHARLKHMILYSVMGLIVGLALGLAIVIIRAMVSDRLRKRDDVAYALGAPVRLTSAGGAQTIAGKPQLTAVRAGRQRIAAYLRRARRGPRAELPHWLLFRLIRLRRRPCLWSPWPCPVPSGADESW
jgi:capsular polysaccharide biosynthesis protein